MKKQLLTMMLLIAVAMTASGAQKKTVNEAAQDPNEMVAYL